jgi:hypothetical protein
MDMNSRMAMAEKLSVQQLQQAVQSGSLPAYIGIPLIEQKTKEKAQMAAAQGGQQKPPSVAASILQQAEQQEQQERGIDELPSNLPVMDDQEMGMAGGGIVAFAERGQVRDPEQDPLIVALRQDPAYLAFAESGGVEGDTSLTAFLQAGNTPSPPASQSPPQMSAEQPKGSPSDRAMADTINRINSSTTFNRNSTTPSDAFKNDPGYDPVPASPAGRFIQDKITDTKGTLNTYGLRERLYKQYSPAALGLSNASDAERTAAQEMLKRIRDMSGAELRALAEQGKPPAMTAVEGTSIPARMQPTAAPQVPAPQARQADADLDNRMLVDSNAGITAAPGAKSVNPVVPGAPRTAPQGGGGRPNALPPTLAAAERSDSPAANQATSMLDKYVAMLEKSGEDVGRQKKEALYMALIQGGLGMMGGTSPNAFANIAAGLLPATQAYQQAMRDIKKDDRARIEKLINAGLSKEKFAMELRKLGIEDKKADAMINYYNARAGAAGSGGGGGSDAKKQTTYVQATRNYTTAIGNIDNKIAKIKESQFYGMDPAKFPSLAGKIKATNDAVAAFEKQKRDISKEHQGFIKELGINVPDYENRPANGNDIDLNQFFKKP